MIDSVGSNKINLPLFDSERSCRVDSELTRYRGRDALITRINTADNIHNYVCTFLCSGMIKVLIIQVTCFTLYTVLNYNLHARNDAFLAFGLSLEVKIREIFQKKVK